MTFTNCGGSQWQYTAVLGIWNSGINKLMIKNTLITYLYKKKLYDPYKQRSSLLSFPSREQI
jgi:hypothetical protein